MSGPAETVRLEPSPARSLRDLLFERGVEFPCGGAILCAGCKVRVLEGDVPVTEEMRSAFTATELGQGWRLGCMAESDGPVTLEIAQWTVEILDDRAVVPFEPADGLGAVIDVGTTTVVAQLVDRRTGRVLAVESALNPQARFGADLMSRIRFELSSPGTLSAAIREATGTMLARLAAGRPIEEALLVGNTAMHHLFGGLDVAPLAAVPFRSPSIGPVLLEAGELGWPITLNSPACFLPCIGGFVGSDILAGIVATGLFEGDEPGVLLDLGTNGEIVVGDRRGLRCASAAAGPAFEGGNIGLGMRAGTGAIDRVTVANGALRCTAIGGATPRGICGSGLVDAAAAALDLGLIDPSGRIAGGTRTVPLCGTVALAQSDIRELQLAKGALAAGLDMLLEGRRPASGRLYLAGAFGNYVRADSARRIGLIPEWAERPTPAGNAALRGARMLLLAPSRRRQILDQVLAITEHVELAADPRFQDEFVDHMRFG
ncbi:ASKHA domain-containing protein [Aquisphaera insulae]|uniref:ASKHA domain-containing protein n=1 Tax=Aquisphaera insulae TaxID=2712864 RepID=UPI0013ECCB57|nr:ASKHA domain-containing protein [Aquisphaera insulae]